MLQRNISLKDYSNYKIGGPAAYFFNATSKTDLIASLKEWKEIGNSKVFVLGGGTNMLISDEGFSGLVIHNNIKFIKLENENVSVGSGVLLSELVNFCIENSLSGLEWAGGLPGTVGGAIRGNAGAFKGETKDNLLLIESINLETLEIHNRNNSQCQFGYRTSVFKAGDGVGEMIIEATFKFTSGDETDIKKLTQEKIEYRKERHPFEYPNIGSIFKNTPFDKVPQSFQGELRQYTKEDPFLVLLSAKIINLCGLKGKTIGGAQISEKHPNFIVNKGNATASDVHNLINLVKQTVQQKYGIVLEEEVISLI